MPDTERSCSIENVTSYVTCAGVRRRDIRLRDALRSGFLGTRPLRAIDGLRSGSRGGCGPVDQRAARLARHALEADGGVARVESCGDLRMDARIGCVLVPATTPGR